MKKFITLSLSFCLYFTTTAWAYSGNGINRAIQNFSYDINQQGINSDTAMTKLISDLMQMDLKRSEILEYASKNLNSEEYSALLEMISFGESEIEMNESMTMEELQLIIQQGAFTVQSEAGANYAGCAVATTFGVTLIVGAVILGLIALDANGTIDFDNDDSFIDVDSRDTERAQEFGIAAGIAGALGIALTASGSSC